MRRLLPIASLATAVVLAFWRQIFLPEYTLLSGSDLCAQTYPWLSVAAHWIKKGVFILWDPYVYAGKANLGELQPGVLYPLNWLVCLLPQENGGVNLAGLQGLILVHFLLAAWFTYRLARSCEQTSWAAVLSGAVFALSGFTARVSGWVNIFCGFAWMPLVLLLYRRALQREDWRRRLRLLVWAGIVMAVSLLAGHHVSAIHTGLLLLFYTLYVLWHPESGRSWTCWPRALISLALVPLTCGLLAAVQLLPSAEWARHALRWIGGTEPIHWGERIPYTVLQTTGNVSPQDALSLLFPYASTSWNLYVGPAVLFLAVVGLLFASRLEARFFGVLLFLYFFVSWGMFSALHGWINTFLPGVWFAREVFHYLVPFQLCLALLAGWGLDAIVSAYAGAAGHEVRTFVRRSGYALSLGVLAIGFLVLAMRVFSSRDLSHAYFLTSARLAAYMGAFGCLLFFLHTRRMSVPAFRLFLSALILVDLSSHISEEARTTDRHRGQSDPAVQSYWRRTPLLNFLTERRQAEVFRLDDPDQVLPPNFGDVWRIEEAMGHGATGRKDYFAFRGTGWGPWSNAAALLNLRYVVSRTEIPGLKRVFGETDAVYYNPRAVPRAFASGVYRVFDTDEEVLRWVPRPLLAPTETVLLTKDELRRMPAAVLSAMKAEGDGIDVRVVSSWRESERRAERAGDAEERRRLTVLGAPWGWSPGDELTLSLRPREPIDKCFLIVRYYATGSAASVIAVRREGPEGTRELPLLLPGTRPGASEYDLQRVALDFGPLLLADYHLSFVRTAECMANIDSALVSRSVPDFTEGHPGTVEVTALRPNSMKLRADLKRPALVVVSDLHDPGWKAEVDGEFAPVLKSDFLLKAVPVPAGIHQVVLRYQPPAFFWGLGITLATLLLVLWIIFR